MAATIMRYSKACLEGSTLDQKLIVNESPPICHCNAQPFVIAKAPHVFFYCRCTATNHMEKFDLR